jgi:uncharacterized protein with ParB-like and HNH nuclease domain
MSYEGRKIKDIIAQISENKIYLPAIQRKFVWEVEQITDLFDSIMKGYPIGTFLFWRLQGEDIKPYTFYSFMLHYDVRNPFNEITAKPETKDEILAVLDGQQRLSSLYVALQGTYAFKRPRARRDDSSAFPKRQLCLNILFRPDGEDEDSNYDFRFLTDPEIATTNDNAFWFPVRNVLEWKSVSDCNKYSKEKGYIENDTFIENLSLLWQRLTQENIINYFQLTNPDIEEVLPIFVRINSGGTPLSKTDLLFSTIVATWQDGREQIENLLQTINSKGRGFNFKNDFIMRACLTLTDCPVLFKVKSFKRENIQKIKTNWPQISDSVLKTIDLIVEFGFDGVTLTSHMAVVPIAYYMYNNGQVDNSIKSEIRRYLILAQLNRIYGASTDQVIAKIRDIIKENGFNFSIQNINEKLDFSSQLSMSDNRLDEVISMEKGPYTFMVLSLLYPHLKLEQIQFHQDHIHPAALFTSENLQRLGFEKWWDVYFKKDKLPNLQLLEGSENQAKSKISFQQWLTDNISNKEHYKERHYIPSDVGLEFEAFNEFYEQRKVLMKDKLKEILGSKEVKL